GGAAVGDEGGDLRDLADLGEGPGADLVGRADGDDGARPLDERGGHAGFVRVAAREPGRRVDAEHAEHEDVEPQRAGHLDRGGAGELVRLGARRAAEAHGAHLGPQHELGRDVQRARHDRQGVTALLERVLGRLLGLLAERLGDERRRRAAVEADDGGRVPLEDERGRGGGDALLVLDLLAVPAREPVRDRRRDDAAVRAVRELARGHLVEVAAHRRLGDAELVRDLRHGQAAAVGEEGEHALPPDGLAEAGEADVVGELVVGRRHLMLPVVRPPTRRFSMIAKRMMTGTIATIETPKTYCHAESYCPMNFVRATDSGWLPAVDRMTRDAANSFQAATNVKMIAVTMPGHTSGRLMRNRTVQRPAPSICAASSTSLGTLAKNECMIHTANARLNAALTRIIASHVSTIPKARNWRNRPATSTA